MSKHRKAGRFSMGVKPKIINGCKRRKTQLALSTAGFLSLLMLGACTPAETTTAHPTALASTSTAAQNEAKKTTIPAKATKPKAPAVLLTSDQVRARDKARQYLLLTSFSRSGLIKQLAFEKYATRDATVAVDTLHANWDKQAVKKAKSYLELTSFSRSGLESQLRYDGFTSKQAKHGVQEAY